LTTGKSVFLVIGIRTQKSTKSVAGNTGEMQERKFVVSCKEKTERSESTDIVLRILDGAQEEGVLDSD